MLILSIYNLVMVMKQPVVNQETGSRTILTYRDSDITMQPIELDFEPDVILMDGQEYEISKNFK